MKVQARRHWFRLDLPPDWTSPALDSWRSPSGGILEACEAFRSTAPISAEPLVELHEDWCEERGLHAHETRIEQLGSGVLMVRSYGETRDDAFLMVGHFSWGGRLARLSFRTGLGDLRDEDLAEVLAAFLEFQPLETNS